MTERYGASPEEWAYFSQILGLTEDMLPVVSNPNAKISPNSKMKSLGKTPSMYNLRNEVGGIRNWTDQRPNQSTINAWSKEPDYGICIQTRGVRAIDIDIADPAAAGRVVRTVSRHLPTRIRANSSKSLLAFRLEGEYAKRVIRTEHGIIEFLATGQQFIACGTHPSGARYEWEGGLPDEFPTLTAEEFESIWSALEREFAVESSTSKPSTKKQVLLEAHRADPIARWLIENDQVISQERDGRLHVECPWSGEHTTESAESSTTYFPAHTGGYENGNFKCLHAHCEHRTVHDLRLHLGLAADDFDDISGEPAPVPAGAPPRFEVVPAHLFAAGEPPEWIVQGVLPQAALAVIFGDSGSGKTFAALDLVGAVARGTPWRNRHTRQGSIVYVCAEGAGGFRNRLKAYARQHEIDLAQLPIGVVGDAPNLMAKEDVKALLASIKTFGDPLVIVMDTFAQVMPGANENAGEDVGKALAHCKALHKHTGALVILIHHSGKDATRGARGWSGLRAAADAEIEIIRSEHDRVATVTKLKDGEDGAEFGFKLHKIVLGMDEHGEEVSSCIVEHNEATQRDVRRSSKPIGGKEALVLRILADLADLSEGFASVNDVVTQTVNQLPFDDALGKRDTRRQTVLRAIESLSSGGIIELENGRMRAK